MAVELSSIPHLFFLSSNGALCLLIGVLLDLLLGDRENLPHLVRFMGATINWAEKQTRALLLPEFVAGSAMTIFLIGATYVSSDLFFTLAKSTWLPAYIALGAVAIYFSVSLKCLGDEAQKVLEALEAKDLPLARKRIAMLVSRDTAKMTEEDITKAAVETVAENLVDGIISPFFYAALGGPPLCLCFKMISTLDSMIGYKNKKYLFFGRLAARIDDVANFIPARLSVPIIAACAPLTGMPPTRIFSCALRHGWRHESPNSGYPESAFAAALDIKLGGRVSYFGETKESPIINGQGEAPSAIHIKKAVLLLYASSLLFFSIFLVPGLINALLLR